jgi:hypothetical protein
MCNDDRSETTGLQAEIPDLDSYIYNQKTQGPS